MAFLKYFLLILSVLSVLICCLNDAFQHSIIFLLVDCLLVGALVSLFSIKKEHILLKIGCILGVIAGFIYWSTSFKSLSLFIPLLIAVFSYCLKLIFRFNKVRYLVFYIIFSLSICCALRSFWGHQIFYQLNPVSVAVLENGKWGNAINYEERLSITSQYSYNFLHDFINATKITNLSDLDNFSELWLVTPTKPFSNEQIKKISNWVQKGGRLIIVTDHTDLFGHASAVNPLLKVFGLVAQKDVILDNSGEGGSFYALCEKFRGLSSNSMRGKGETWLFQPGYSERTDYSKRSFFSDNQISDEEIADCYSIGIRTNHGLGGVIVFGDSTLFANFALARPSAQAILKKIIRGGGTFSCYGVAFFLCLLNLTVFLIKSPILKTLGSLFIGSTFFACIISSLSDRELATGRHKIVSVTGDWSLVEGNQAHLLTLFSSAYCSSSAFPIWKGCSENDRSVTIGNMILTEEYFSPVVDVNDIPLQERLITLPKGNFNEQLTKCITTSGYSSFWFDEGVGFLREHSYKLFWRTFTEDERKKNGVSISEPIFVKVQVKAKGNAAFVALVPIRSINDGKDWVFIGDWLVGKYVSEDTILVRAIWQQSSIKIPDFYCRLLPVSLAN